MGPAIRQSVLLACLLIVGCADRAVIHKRTVSDLYVEALQAAAQSNQRDQQAVGTVANVQCDELLMDSELAIPIAEVDSSRSLGTTPAPTGLPSPPGVVSSAGYVKLQDLPEVSSAQEQPVLVDDEFDQTEAHEAITLLAEAAGVKVVYDDSFGGSTSAKVHGVTFEEALEQILAPLGMVYAKDKDTFYITDGNPDSHLFARVAKSQYFSPQNHAASELVTLLPPRFKNFYQVSDERNLIVVEAPQSIGDEIVRRLNELDLPVHQIELEAIVCVTAPDSEFKFGMDWNHVVGTGSTDTLKLGMSGLAVNGTVSRNGMENIFSDFALTSAFVQLLSQEGYVTIRAAPRVTARDGERASISIARETFFSLQPSNSNVLFSQNIQKVEAGITLNITPRVRGEMISIEIEKAEVSEDIRTSEATSSTSSNPYPIINRRLVSSIVNVPNGHTIAIGGLLQRQTVDRINKIPYLSAVPLLGKLFQRVDKQERDTEVAIFISPRIVPASCP